MEKKQKVYCLATRYGKDSIFITKWISKKVRDEEAESQAKSGLSVAKWEEVDKWQVL